MIFPWGIAIGVIVLSGLLFAGLKGLVTARDLEEESCILERDRVEGELATMDLAEHIFSPLDWTLINGLRSTQLAELFRRERKAIALFWVRHTSRMVQQVMREHAETARASRNLEFWTEVKLVLQYAELRLACGVLYAAIQVGGPLWLRGLALHAHELSRRIADAEASFQATRLSYSTQR